MSFLDDRRPASLGDVSRSWWDAKVAERRLRHGGLHRSLLHVERARASRTPRARHAIEHAGQGFAALRLVVTPSGRCLPLALALALATRCAHGDVRLVMGVKLGPFAAHAWVQRGDVVLNDHVEAVRPFTPVFVL